MLQPAGCFIPQIKVSIEYQRENKCVTYSVQKRNKFKVEGGHLCINKNWIKSVILSLKLIVSLLERVTLYQGCRYINLSCLFVCLFVCLYPINVKTAEPIRPKIFVGHLGTPGKVYKWSKFQIFVSIDHQNSIFI